MASCWQVARPISWELVPEEAPSVLSAEGVEAFELLQRTRSFAGASVGIAGTPSGQVEAFRRLLGEPETDRAFKSLQRSATLPGQLYALAGLYFTDQGHLQSTAQKYRRNQTKVETYFGCIIDEQPASRMVAGITDGSIPHAFKGRGG
jgi:hypothetical protein